jgi:transposase
MDYPKWVMKHKKKGTEIRKFNDRYYLYKISSKWNKEKKRAQKITKEYLGVITEEGLIPPKHKQKDDKNLSVTVKEYGACHLFMNIAAEIELKLKEFFPDNYEMIFVLAVLRAINKCPFKRMEHYYINSYISELIPDLNLSGKNISLFLREIGQYRDIIVQFMNCFIAGSQHILFDATNIMSQSKKMDINRLGYNRHKIYDPQINLLYAFACDNQSPIYYRILPGNIRDITAFKLSILEAGLKNAIVVADKGFGSQANIELMDEQDLKYIIPLKRNNSLFDDKIIRTGDKSKFDGHFMFQKRPIWYYSTKIGNSKKVIVYLDEKLKAEEEKDYLQRIEKQLEGYTIENFYEKQYRFGTLIVIANIESSPKEIFELYKSRNQIEQTFDTFKNLLA